MCENAAVIDRIFIMILPACDVSENRIGNDCTGCCMFFVFILIHTNNNRPHTAVIFDAFVLQKIKKSSLQYHVFKAL